MFRSAGINEVESRKGKKTTSKRTKLKPVNE